MELTYTPRVFQANGIPVFHMEQMLYIDEIVLPWGDSKSQPTDPPGRAETLCGMVHLKFRCCIIAAKLDRFSYGAFHEARAYS